MTKQKLFKMIEKMADVKTCPETGMKGLINSDHYIKGLRDGEIQYARYLFIRINSWRKEND